MPHFFARLLDPILRPVEYQARRLARRFRRIGLVERTLSVAGGSMHVWCGGDGPPLLLLHGFGPGAIWQWHAQVRDLAKHHTLVMPDLMFFGSSTSTSPERSIRFQVDAVLEALDALDVETCDVMGLSYGGFVAYMLAATSPERVSRLVLVDSPGPAFHTGDHDALLARHSVSRVHDLILPDGPESVGRLMRISWHRPPPLPRFALRAAYRALFVQQADAQRGLLDSVLGYLDNPPANRGPTGHDSLLVWGQYDSIFPVDLARRLSDELGERCRLEVLPNAAHVPNLERARAFNETVLGFLATP